jgi:putative spermidine/putrescine transport system ATP-binding protein
MTNITLTNLTKIYERTTIPAVDNLNLEIKAGELVAFLGPSGCGKTTTLKMIAGLHSITSGEVLFNGESVNMVKPEKREVVMVYQNYLLFPYMSVEDNVGFGLKMRHMEKAEIKKRVDEMLSLVKLEGFGKRRPHELSGGQKQRIALARALVVRPKVLLLDEPLSNLDAHLRDEMRELILKIYKEFDVTIIFVTHDQEEAVQLADRIALMFDGELQQFSPSQDFYERPATLRIASFFGNNNHIKGTKKGTVVSTAMGDFSVKDDIDVPDGKVCLIIRPESIQMGGAEENSFEADIDLSIYMGTYTRYRINMDGERWDVTGSSHFTEGFEEGKKAAFSLPKEKIWLLSEE